MACCLPRHCCHALDSSAHVVCIQIRQRVGVSVCNYFPAFVPPFQQLTVIMRSDVVLKDAYRNDNPVFGPYYDAGRPLNRVTGITRANPHQLVDIAARDLFAKLAAPVSNNTYYYYSGNIQHVEALVEDILPFDVMLQLDASGTDQNVNVWFGMNGVTGTRPNAAMSHELN